MSVDRPCLVCNAVFQVRYASTERDTCSPECLTALRSMRSQKEKRYCSIDGCGKPYKSRGLCAGHEWRSRKGRDLGTGPIGRPPRTQVEQNQTGDSRIVPLTRGHSTIVDTADYERVLAAGPWYALEGMGSLVYAVRAIKKPSTKSGRGTLSLHTFLTGFVKVDHINRNPLDNRRANLRDCPSDSLNAANAFHRTNSTGYKGVVFRKDGRSKPWAAQMRYFGKQTYLGAFETAEEAAIAYDTAAIDAWGEYAYLNILKWAAA